MDDVGPFGASFRVALDCHVGSTWTRAATPSEYGTAWYMIQTRTMSEEDNEGVGRRRELRVGRGGGKSVGDIGKRTEVRQYSLSPTTDGAIELLHF